MDARVIVVGGGITGVGIARDLAMRGVDVLLFERDHLAAGTTGRMHGLLHSGARYAVSDPDAARECRRENAVLRETAGHCIEDTGGLFVSLAGDDPDYYEEKLAACRRVGIPVEEVTAKEALSLEPALSENVERAFRVPDAAIDPFRLVQATAESAREHGARIETGRTVTGILRDDGRVSGVRVETDAGESREYRCEHVINAAGPWAGELFAGLDVGLPLAPAHGAMAVTNARPVDTVINRCRPTDEGDILVPHETTAILGTTDREIEAPEDVTERGEEIDLLREELSALVPELAETRLIRAYWGVRPLFDPDAGGESGRDFAVLDHAERDGLAGLTTVVGGKLTTYRLMAETVVDHVADRLGVEEPCRTADEPLPGAGAMPDPEEVADRFELTLPVASRTIGRLGDRTEAVLGRAGPNPVVCECEGVTVAEVDDAIERVGPDLAGVRNLTRATMGPCQGGVCAHRVAGLLAESADGETARRELSGLLEERESGQEAIDSLEQVTQRARNRRRRTRLLHAAQLDSPGPLDLDAFGDDPVIWESKAGSSDGANLRGWVGRGSAHDVVVLGSGLAARLAAIAATEAGLSVALLPPQGLSADRIPGGIDLVGVDPRADRGDRLVAKPFDAIEDLSVSHPYRRFGEGSLREAMATLEEVTGELFAESAASHNGLLPSPIGTPLPRARFPLASAPGLLSRQSDMLVVGLASIPALQAPFLAANLDSRVPYRVRGETISPCDRAPEVPLRRFAWALDRNERWPGDRPVRHEITEAIEAVHDGEPRIGLPSMLGVEHTPEIRADLGDRLGAEIFEVPLSAPSAAGMRLAGRLEAWLRERGVRIRQGVAGTVRTDGDRVRAIQARDGPTIEADAFVLATGGVAAGGLVRDGERLIEPWFELPVAFGPSEHVTGVGLRTDRQLRPRTESGDQYRNLWAAGSILGGFDAVASHSTGGVSVLTGVRAGEAAVEAVTHD